MLFVFVGLFGEEWFFNYFFVICFKNFGLFCKFVNKIYFLSDINSNLRLMLIKLFINWNGSNIKIVCKCIFI